MNCANYERVLTALQPTFTLTLEINCDADPKILATPDAAWINKPAAQEEESKLAA